MFGHAYFGAPYFGPPYFGGDAGGLTPPGVVDTGEGGDDRLGRRELYRVRRSHHKGFDLEEWKRRHPDEKLEALLRKTWARIRGDPEAVEAKADVAEVVQEFERAPTKARKSLEKRIDWAALARDMQAAEEVFRIDQERRARHDEESEDDEVLEMLLMQ